MGLFPRGIGLSTFVQYATVNDPYQMNKNRRKSNTILMKSRLVHGDR